MFQTCTEVLRESRMSHSQLRANAKPFLPPLMIPTTEEDPSSLVEWFILVRSLVRQEGEARGRHYNFRSLTFIS